MLGSMHRVVFALLAGAGLVVSTGAPVGAAPPPPSGAVISGDLVLQGVSGADAPIEVIELELRWGGTAVMHWEHRDSNGDLIQSGSDKWTGVVDDVLIDLNTGENRLTVTTVEGSLLDDLAIQGRGDKQTVLIDGVVAGSDIEVADVGFHPDSVAKVTDATAGDDIVLYGFQTATVHRSTAVHGDIAIYGTHHRDVVEVLDSKTGSDLEVHLFGGNDRVNVTGVIVGGVFELDLGAGDDHSTVRNVSKQRTFDADGGAGFDRLVAPHALLHSPSTTSTGFELTLGL